MTIVISQPVLKGSKHKVLTAHLLSTKSGFGGDIELHNFRIGGAVRFHTLDEGTHRSRYELTGLTSINRALIAGARSLHWRELGDLLRKKRQEMNVRACA